MRPIEEIYALKRDLLGFIGPREDCKEKIKDLNHVIRRSLCFIEGLHAIKRRGVLWFISRSKEICVQKLLTKETIISLGYQLFFALSMIDGSTMWFIKVPYSIKEMRK